MSFHYSGDELPLMAQAVRWKSYVAAQLRPYLGPSVLEVGAGIGGNIPHLFHPPVQHWTALEPDAAQARQITDPRARVVVGALDALAQADRFDTIAYLDVLEHVADDTAELRQAASHLLPGGHLIVLAPAYPFLFSPMDTEVGHYRRYTRGRLREITPPGCRIERLRHLDSAGFFASLANRLVLRAPALSPAQVSFWDGTLVPASRILDPLIGYRFGRSLLAVWRCAG
jgi:SAM-dependent methyltransferase